MSHIITCPNCSTQVRVPDRSAAAASICPRCLADMSNPQPTSPIPGAAIRTDVKRDLSVGSIVLVVLILLCVLGVAAALAVPLPDNTGGYGGLTRAMYLMLPFAALDVLVSVAIIRGLLRKGVFDTGSANFGTALGIMFLSLGTIGAVCIFFFFTCLGLLSIH